MVGFRRAALAAAVCFCASPAAAAITLDYYTPSGSYSPVGEAEAGDPVATIPSGNPFASYFGQAFTAQVGLATELTFGLSHNNAGSATADGIDFRVLLTRVTSTADGWTPTDIVYESGLYTLGNALGTSGTPVTGPAMTINLGGVDLVDYEVYAWVIDTRSSADGLGGWGAVRTNTDTPENAFAGLYDLTDEQLAQPWIATRNLDLAYRLVFEDGGVADPNLPSLGSLELPSAPGYAPEPSTWALLIGGFGMAGLALRARRRPALG
jgi:hypothetical protein